MAAFGKQRWIGAIALVATFAILDSCIGTLWEWNAMEVSRPIAWPYGTLYLGLPQTLAGILIGWLAARDLRLGAYGSLGIGLALVICRLVTRAYTGAIFYMPAAVSIPEFIADAGPMLVTYAAAYAIAQRGLSARTDTARVTPALALLLVVFTLAEVAAMPYAHGAFFRAVPDLPLDVAPVLLSVLPAIFYLAVGYACRRWRWLPAAWAAFCVAYACVLHLGTWASMVGFGSGALAATLTWVPTAVIALAFTAGWWVAGRRGASPLAVA